MVALVGARLFLSLGLGVFFLGCGGTAKTKRNLIPLTLQLLYN